MPSFRRYSAPVVGLFCLLLPLAVLAQSSSFTYQGQLRLTGQPFTGTADLEFRLYDQLSGGNAIGLVQSLPNWPVEDGLFQVELDYGTAAFDGSDRFLEITVNGAPLIPRQKVTATPYALKVRGLRIEPSTETFDGSPITTNTIAGPSANEVTPGVRGATIAGGGVPGGNSDPDLQGENPNVVTDHYGTVGGGYGNVVGNESGTFSDRAFATVSGGRGNRASGLRSSIGGGLNNQALGTHGTVAGGFNNRAGASNTTVGGGSNNFTEDDNATIAGGSQNRATGISSTVSGGNNSTASGNISTVAGGSFNFAIGSGSVISGGNSNQASGAFSSVLGGSRNIAFGDYSVVMGRRARNGNADHDGVFMFADSQDVNFDSTGPDQFLLRAGGGMAINTNSPRAPLTVQTAGKWNPEVGNGFGDFHIGNATLGLAIGVATGGGGAGAVRIWPTGGNQELTFTTGSLHPFQTLTLTDSGRVGVRRTPTLWEFEVEGNAAKSIAGEWLANSDARIKTDIREIENPLDRLMQIRPVTFRYTDEYRIAHPVVGDSRYYNVIAQEFARVFPEAVHQSGEYLPEHEESPENEILQVDVHPAMITSIAAVQELAVRLQATERENAELRMALERLEARVSELSAARQQ